jgi:hypothetical protein
VRDRGGEVTGSNGQLLNGVAECIPPHSREAERSTLGAMLRDNSVIPSVRSIVAAESYYVDAHQKIHRAIERLSGDGNPVDLVILAEHLRSQQQLEDVGNYAYLAELWESAPTAANAEYYARVVREKGETRSVMHLAAELYRDARDAAYPAEELIARLGNGAAALGASTNLASAWTPKPQTPAEMATADYRHDWLVKRLLVIGEPAVIFGPSKILKTSFVVDLCVMLANGGLVLGEFEALPKKKGETVQRRARVLLISGESGPAALWSIAQRVCQTRGIDAAELGDRLQIECSIPPLWSPAARQALLKFVRLHRSDVVIIDPAYLTLLRGEGDADAAKSMFAMGPILGALASPLRQENATPMIVHHTNTSLKIGEVPELKHIAYAGFQQFARQWIGLNRMTPFTHDGKHELVMVAGGSAGHGGSWNLTIDEGELAEDFSGRKWDVTVEASTKVKAERKAESKREKEEQAQADDLLVAEAIDGLWRNGTPATTRRIRDELSISNPRIDKALARLAKGAFTRAKETVTTGGGKQSAEVYRRAKG